MSVYEIIDILKTVKSSAVSKVDIQRYDDGSLKKLTVSFRKQKEKPLSEDRTTFYVA